MGYSVKYNIATRRNVNAIVLLAPYMYLLYLYFYLKIIEFKYKVRGANHPDLYRKENCLFNSIINYIIHSVFIKLVSRSVSVFKATNFYMPTICDTHITTQGEVIAI